MSETQIRIKASFMRRHLPKLGVAHLHSRHNLRLCYTVKSNGQSEQFYNQPDAFQSFAAIQTWCLTRTQDQIEALAKANP